MINLPYLSLCLYQQMYQMQVHQWMLVVCRRLSSTTNVTYNTVALVMM